MTQANQVISVSMVVRMISKLVDEGLVKSYFGTLAKRRRTNPSPRPYAESRHADIESNRPGDVVQLNTMFVKTSLANKYL